MAFSRPLLLLALSLLAYFVWLGRPTGRHGRGRAWAALALRCLIVALIILSLAGLRTVHGSDTLAVVFLVDVSDSVPQAEQDRALAFVRQSLAAMGPDDRAALILFGADALVERAMSASTEISEIASIPRTHQTDVEEAIRLGLALFPEGAARRMVLLSDGRPTTGDAAVAVRLARAHGVELAVVPLGALGDEGGLAEARLSALELPTRLRQGETCDLNVTVESTARTSAGLTILSGQRVVAQRALSVSPGVNRFAIPLTVGEPGFATYRAVLSPAADAYPQNNARSAFAMVEGPPRILIVAAHPGEAALLRDALAAAGMDARSSTPAAIPTDPAALAEYAAVVLVNTPAQSLSPRAMGALQAFVRDLGGGLVAVGGPDAYGVGGWYETPLEETLPVAMTIEDPQRFPPMSIVVIVDKSGSMSATESGVPKIRLAGEAAARVAELINDTDEITIIAFDDRPADIIGPLPGSERAAVTEQAIRLQAGGGGIYVRESLQTALEILAASERPVRHIVLLADGSDSEHQEGVREMVEEQIAGQNITLSTVAIGMGQDVGFLEEIAAIGGGRFYFTAQAADLPTIFAQETQLAMRTYIVEEPFFPRQTATSPILEGLEAVPSLTGYVATSPKPAAQVILTTHQDDPLLAAWQYGLGRAVAWTSDASGRWAARWVTWEAFPRFWAQAVGWTLARQSDAPLEMTVALEGETALVAVDALDAEGAFVNGLAATVSVVGPDGQASPVELAQTAPGRYEGTFVPAEEGAYLLRFSGSLDGGEALAMTAGWVLDYSPEYATLGSDPAYLVYLAELGGGQALEEPAAAFAHTLRGAGTAHELWPALLGLAALLLPFDVGVRRLALGRGDLARGWAWMRQRLPRRRPRPAVAGESPVSRLFAAKERVGRRHDPEAAPPPLEPSPPPPRATPPPPPPATGDETIAERLLRRRKTTDRNE